MPVRVVRRLKRRLRCVARRDVRSALPARRDSQSRSADGETYRGMAMQKNAAGLRIRPA